MAPDCVQLTMDTHYDTIQSSVNLNLALETIPKHSTQKKKKLIEQTDSDLSDYTNKVQSKRIETEKQKVMKKRRVKKKSPNLIIKRVTHRS